MITGYDLIDYYEDTRLYSTGDDYLDDLLEKAFCDGYEYAQREFAEKKGIFKSIGDSKKALKSEGITPTIGNFKSIVAGEIQRSRHEGPDRWSRKMASNPKKLTKSDCRILGKYFPKNA